ncbi:MAG: ABC transporter permease [Bryobacteraceae bacterium]|nr:ABC transporter permease [Bryobacteraceae bacterium]
MQDFLSDLRYGARLLLKKPAFSLIVILVLGLGIGANTAIYSTVDAMLIRPLPFHEAERLVMVWEDITHLGFPRNTPAPANFVDWRKQNTVFEDMAAYRFQIANLTGDGAPEQIAGLRTMPNLFPILGVKPLLGRWLEERDEVSEQRSLVISYGLWQRRFGGDPNVVGRTLSMSDVNYTVVGVMPATFRFPAGQFDYYARSGLTARDLARRGSHFLQVVARMKPGVTLQGAQTEMASIMKRLEREYPDTNRRVGGVVQPLRDAMLGKTGLELLVLLAASACVLLIACANVANLLLARSSARWREMAVRSALGAGGGRLARQLLTESLMLASAGGVAGVAVAFGSLALLAKLIPEQLQGLMKPSVDARMLVFAFAVAVGTGLLFGVAPAWQAARAGMSERLREGARAGSSRRSKLFRHALVAGEVALASCLLAGAALLVQTLLNLQNTDIGFEPRGVLTARTRLPLPRYADNGKKAQFYDNVLSRIEGLPGVVSAGYTSTLPFLQRGNSTGFAIEGMPPIPVDSLIRVCTSEYLTTIGSRLLEGRLFGRDDRAHTQRVMVINETFKKAFFPNESAVGKRISVDGSDWFVVAGVVRDVLERGLEQMAKPTFYFLYNQQPDTWAVPAEIAVKATGDPMRLAAGVREAVWAVDKDQPVTAVRTLEEIVGAEVAGRRQQVQILTVFTGVAVLLACLGIYGVLSYMVTLGTRDIGVRMALGARGGDVVSLVVGQGLRLAGVGLLTGMAAALAGARLLSSLLYGVKPADPATFVGVCLLMGVVSAAACYLPARRAARIDPMVALRVD